MSDNRSATAFIKELEAETTATRTCLERIPGDLQHYKPHEKSMEMGALALLTAEIPLWISYLITDGDIDLATFPHKKVSGTGELVKFFDDNIAAAKKALAGATDEDLSAEFNLKVDGKAVMTLSKRDTIEQSINHLVHHRGQLTVYMRLNDIEVPSIYGPSADTKGF